ncbi:MAG TPA: lactate racemase domain-containing protein [Polyangiaceae bacterium]|nr:lactate racemase domain-containing protein [Polyangiaceae bacterium]
MSILVTGVTGARKSTIGQRLAGRLGLRFVESDHGPPPIHSATTLSVHVGPTPPPIAATSATAFAFSPELSDAEIVERVARAHVRSGAPRGSLRTSAADAALPLTSAEVERVLDELVSSLGSPRRVLLLPPDATRAHSGAGELTSALYRRLSPSAEVKVLPALGTHEAMSPSELSSMFPGVPHEQCLVHDFRRGVATLGEVPGSFVSHVSDARVDYPVPCQVSQHLASGYYDRIISIGQLVPHEVIGIANHAKNVFVGTGGKESIDRSHFLGAVCGMESMMGRAHTPVRDVLNYMSAQLAAELPITYLCTVRKKDAQGQIQTHGLYAGDDEGCFLAGAPLVQRLNLDLLERPLERVVVYLEPHEFRTTWLGNKAIYRTRMAIADGGELIVLGPGVRRFGEDAGIDQLIRRHGYRGTAHTLEQVQRDPELGRSLSAAAHLIHASSEGRFRVRWAAGGLSRQEVESVGYEWADVGELLQRYAPNRLQDGPNTLPDGEELFFVSNPGLGLWALRQRFST